MGVVFNSVNIEKIISFLISLSHIFGLRRITINRGFKDFKSAQGTLAGIEIISIIRKDHIKDSKFTMYKTFNSLAA